MTETADMDKSFEASPLEESVHVITTNHSCECGYSTSDKSNFNKYKKRCRVTRIAAPPTATQEPVAHVCDQCGKHLKSKFGFSLHIKNEHTQEYKYECTLCDRKYNQYKPYKYHCAKHLKVSLDTCPHCKKVFNSPESLQRHLVMCSGDAGTSKPYKCDQFPASFPHKYRLTYHQKGKHGPKRYTCEFCGNRYGWRSSLQEHVQACQAR